MSKGSYKHPKEDNIDTSMDTSSKLEPNPFFPSVLRGKRVSQMLNNKKQRHIENYLSTESPKHLFKAIKEDEYCLEGTGLTADDLRDHPEITEIDVHSVVWITIKHWQNISMNLLIFIPDCDSRLRNEGSIEEAKRLLKSVGNALIPDSKPYYKRECGSLFFHKLPAYKGDDASLNYENAKDFLDYWNGIESSFKSNLKKRYKGVEQQNIDEFFEQNDSETAILHRMFTEDKPKVDDIKDVIETEFGDKISETAIQNEFKFNTVRNNTASYIAWKNEHNCSMCKEAAQKRKLKANKKGKKIAKVSYKTILGLRSKANNELKT